MKKRDHQRETIHSSDVDMNQI